jgi:hypothetical protein
VPAEIALVALAGVGVDAAIAWARRGGVQRVADRARALEGASFLRVLGGVTAVGLVVRVAFAWSRRDSALLGDDFWYHWQARALADRHWFVDPLAWRTTGALEPSAGHAPLYPAVLSVLPAVGIDSAFAMRLVSCLMGAGTVFVIGLVGRRVAGPRVGVIAAAFAAISPSLWINDGMLLSESLYALTIAGTLYFAYTFWEAPTARNAVLLGVVLGLAALTRPEALLLAVLLAVTWFVRAGARPWRERLARVSVVGGVVLLVLAPWIIRNLLVFDETVTVSDSQGTVLATGNCDGAYYGPLIGTFDIECIFDAFDATPAERAEIMAGGGPALGRFLYEQPGDESVSQGEAQRVGLDYMREHAGRVPLVAAARVARAWDVIWPNQQVRFNSFVERRGVWPSRVAIAVHWVVLALSVWALVVARRRRLVVAPLVVVCVMAIIAPAMSLGLPRYRLAADVALMVLAAIGVDALLDRGRPADAERPVA